MADQMYVLIRRVTAARRPCRVVGHSSPYKEQPSRRRMQGTCHVACQIWAAPDLVCPFGPKVACFTRPPGPRRTFALPSAAPKPHLGRRGGRRSRTVAQAGAQPRASVFCDGRIPIGVPLCIAGLTNDCRYYNTTSSTLLVALLHRRPADHLLPAEALDRIRPGLGLLVRSRYSYASHIYVDSLGVRAGTVLVVGGDRLDIGQRELDDCGLTWRYQPQHGIWAIQADFEMAVLRNGGQCFTAPTSTTAHGRAAAREGNVLAVFRAE